MAARSLAGSAIGQEMGCVGTEAPRLPQTQAGKGGLVSKKQVCMGLTTDCQRDRRWCVRQGNKARGSKGAQKALKKVGRARQNSVKSVLRPSTHRGIPTCSVQRGRPRRIEWMDKQQRVTRCIGVLCIRCGVVLDVCV
jgi:hypothetical protein